MCGARNARYVLDAAARCPSVGLPADDPNVKPRSHPVDAAVSAHVVQHFALAVAALVVVLWFDPAVWLALAVAVPVVALCFDPVVCSDLAVAVPAVALGLDRVVYFDLAVVSVYLCLAGLAAAVRTQERWFPEARAELPC